MEKFKSIVIILLAVIIVLLSALLIRSFVVEKKNQSASNQPNSTQGAGANNANNNSGQEATNPNGNLFFDKVSDLPQAVYGTIDSVDQNKLILKQNASVDIKYQINKSDISSITEQKNNPAFNKEKADQLNKEIQDYLTKNSSSGSAPMSANPNSPAAKPNLPQDLQDQIKEPDVQYLVEEKVDWNALKSGMTVNYQTDEKGNKTLRVFSADSIIAPK